MNQDTRHYSLPVDDPRHTEVLGYHCTTTQGKSLYKQLDWKNWTMDGPEAHLFNAGGYYFRVRTKHKDPNERVVYRVRCWYAGGKYKGWPVTGIRLGCVGGKLHWLVDTKRPEAEGKP